VQPEFETMSVAYFKLLLQHLPEVGYNFSEYNRFNCRVTNPGSVRYEAIN